VGCGLKQSPQDRGPRTFEFTRRGVLYLLDVYAKSAKEDLTNAEKREIRKLVAAIEAEE